MGQELVDVQTGEMTDAGMGLSVSRPPELVLAEAQRAAKALTDVMKKKAKPVMMNGEQYLEFEDWQTVGKFYGLAAKVATTNPIELGGARGFEARAVVVDVKTGVEVSAADSMCLNDEPKWSTRAKYEWKTVNGKRVKEQVGEEAVPMFQLRSMAQTRACAKALRNVLAWVVVLAGYKPTPAEEMTGHEKGGNAEAGEESPYKSMKSKFKGFCAICNDEIPVGSDIIFDSKTRKAAHAECFEEQQAAARAQGETDEPGRSEAHA